jgi:Zn-dependent peptidase ImmA (M78 family)
MSARFLTLIDDSDVLDQLRALVPKRPLIWTEAHSVAERQAMLLLGLMNVPEPPVPQFVICNLPGIIVDWRTDWPADGTSIKTRTHWQIVIRSSDIVQRQRFSLAHELKHVLDDPVIDRLYSRLPADLRHERAERLCNWFAACLLMPRPWLKRDWYGGIQRVRELAKRYFVSEEAMTTRLSEIGILPMTLALEPGMNRHAGAAL